jgi:hypothetical protein
MKVVDTKWRILLTPPAARLDGLDGDVRRAQVLIGFDVVDFGRAVIDIDWNRPISSRRIERASFAD